MHFLFNVDNWSLAMKRPGNARLGTNAPRPIPRKSCRNGRNASSSGNSRSSGPGTSISMATHTLNSWWRNWWMLRTQSLWWVSSRIINAPISKKYSSDYWYFSLVLYLHVSKVKYLWDFPNHIHVYVFKKKKFSSFTLKCPGRDFNSFVDTYWWLSFFVNRWFRMLNMPKSMSTQS